LFLTYNQKLRILLLQLVRQDFFKGQQLDTAITAIHTEASSSSQESDIE